MSRNQKYELKQRSRGLSKVTLWVPESSEIELKQMAQFLCENPDYIPFMVRSITTGKMRKAV
ncbi:hypothetical protein [Shewanella xiamenensis]|uniref:hypothetical protein n=1 Tax=Shewanella xiamenensis TaxID=332186 RepID=UPI001F052AF0|nr:hypothetical protein [Shewanella xiamenensis]UML95622.1 hypothetical protein MKD32_10170 [Shewanella xiamenensis]UML95633.1 hypothetical protein MKD32_10225 [Shewanella xiamenensis]